MKLQFEPKLAFQLQAIEAVCDVFEGQESKPSAFTVLRPKGGEQLSLGERAEASGSLGVGNRLSLLEEELLAHLRKVQLRHGLPPTEAVDLGDLNLTVEMETGTGKTYVYLRTIYELNKAYGFTKFIVVVPSIAIKEGVAKSLEIMRDHFAELYGNPPFNWFVYDSSNLGQVRGFATSPHIEVMVATIQALHKTDQRLFHQPTEKLGGAKPIELIQQVRPIVIVDEPQSVDGGDQGAGREALREMQPLCTLRYSATHVNKHDMVYRLDAVDAYERRLVKGIEVASAQVEGAHDQPFVRLVEVCRKGRSNIYARVELDCVGGPDGVTRVVRNVHENDDLEQVTRRSVYRDVRVGEIVKHYSDKRMLLHVPGDSLWLNEGEAHGDVPIEALQRQMIRRTIRQHLDRELTLRPRGIKVLSLFFVDEVQHYRSYDEDGQPVKGKFATMFEEEYAAAAKLGRYSDLFGSVDLAAVDQVHDGYFSIDKQRKWVDTYEGNQGGRDAAEAAYNLIMKDKEKLLSLDTPLKFIFSHSALKEGWDNPNVFQICSLREMSSERQRRQSIGRGLRLCVNQDGRRVREDGVNRLTVIATESVAQFAAKLQEEMEKETGIKFGVVEKHTFASIPVMGEDGEPTALGVEQSETLWTWLKSQGYIDRKGKVQEKLARELQDNTFKVPEAFHEQQQVIARLLRKLTKGIEVKDADKAKPVKIRREVLDSPEFKALWNRIKYRTAYQVEFDPDALIDSCVEAMKASTFAPGRARLLWTKAKLGIDKAGVHARDEKMVGSPSTLGGQGIPLPDILTELQDATGLTRRSLAAILTESEQLYQFEASPQAFIKATADLINRKRREAIVEGVKYERLGDSEYYAMSLFDDQELRAYIGENTVASTKSPYEHVVYDSGGVEKTFAEFLEGSDAVKLFAKLPSWFKIPTPLGTYNPDWAVLVDTDEGERLYFVIETKGSLDPTDLRNTEAAKIHCGRRHFEVLADVPSVVADGGPVRYDVATKGGDFTKLWGS